MLYRAHLDWIGFELTLVMICTDCIGNCKSNHHTIMTTTAPESGCDLRQVSGFLQVLHQLNWPPRYNWNMLYTIIKTSPNQKVQRSDNKNWITSILSSHYVILNINILQRHIRPHHLVNNVQWKLYQTKKI
jgi:hypothetical protein